MLRKGPGSNECFEFSCYVVNLANKNCPKFLSDLSFIACTLHHNLFLLVLSQTLMFLGVSSATPRHEEEEENEEFSLAPDRFNTAPVLFSDGIHSPPPPAIVPTSLVARRSASILVEPQNQSPLEQLVDMGFYDIEMNKDLLLKYRNDVNKVVNALVRDPPRNRDHGSNRRPDGGYCV